MSDELVVRLRQQGYDAEYVGVKYNGTCHAIVCYEQCINYMFDIFCYEQCIESTRGTFINPHVNEPYSFDRTGCRNVTER